MNKIIILLFSLIFSSTAIFVATGNEKAEKKELRPSQKLMQARAASLKSMSENLAAGKFAELAKEATTLSAETKNASDNLTGEKKDITAKISVFSSDAADAAAKKKGDVVKAKLGEIKAACGSCHVKYRDKK